MFDISFDVSKRSRASFQKIVGVGFLLAILLAAPLLSLIPPVSADPTTVLTPKWTRTGMGTNWEGGLVIGDVTGDGQEDVVYCGGGSDIVYVLDGDDGSTIATYTNNRIGTYTQPQLYDVDGDGILDIIIAMYYPPSCAVIQYDGHSSLALLWIKDTQTGGGTLGSIMAKPVAGDIDGDGNLDIFVASQDVSYGDNSTGNYSPNNRNGYDGTIVRLDNEGNILYTTFTWRACSGGLSLGDTDNDGVLELYQGDRQMGYLDGGYGKGAKSYWAEDLIERWIRLDFLSSSQAPVLVDVNGDGILDVLAGMYGEMNILNSTNGEWIQRWGGRGSGISVHYGFTVYDIDGDGNLELLCNDGDHDEEPYTDIFDLVTGEMDAQLYHFGQVFDDRPRDAVPPGQRWKGTSKWSPVVADIDPTHSGMEIISVPEGTGLDGGNYWNGAILIWSYNGTDYVSLQNVTRSPSSTPGVYSNTRLGSQLGFPVVQDIDGDGLLELVTHSSGGNVYAFDTVAPAPGYSPDLPGSKRIRSEVTYYGEKRLGVAEHTIAPWEEDYWTAPLVAPISPVDNALVVPQSTTQLSFQLREHQSEPITYNVTTSPGVGSVSGSNSSNSYEWSTYTLDLNTTLEYDTTYRWTITANDGSEVTKRTYTFRTELEPNEDNNPPEQDNPQLESDDGLDTTTSTFICSNQSTTDTNGDCVTNIYRWMVNDEPVARLLLPFDTRNETLTKDYSGYGNNGTVIGTTWVPDGIVGGAYSFDGKDDAVIISDGGDGYFNDRNYTSNNEELGGFGNWNAVTVEAWIYLTEYNNGSRVVAKIPSYALGFASGYTNRLSASVWPMGFKIADDDNQASTDQEQSASANVDIELNTWYHIAFTYESGVGIKLYFNGEMVSQSSAYEGPVKISRGEPVYIGRLVQPFAGMIDEVRMYNYAQPEEQIYNRYMESKDGNSSSSLFLPTGIGFPGDELTCEVIPTDSFEEGTTTSASVILQNSLPSVSNLEIYPIRDRALRLDDEDLIASYEYVDPDSDAEAASKIEWFMNGVSQPAFENLTEIPAESTTVGQEWNFTVTPQDSWGDFGIPRTSYTITIRDNAAPTTDTPDLVSSLGEDEDDEDLIASAVGSSDTDSDPVTNIYRWTLEGTSMANLLMPFDVETPQYFDATGTTLDYSGYGNDGTVVGARWVEEGIVGGAFSFDGNDFIRIQESGNSLGGDGGWSEISVEFWVKATGTTSSEEAILMHDTDFSTSSSSPYGISYRVRFRAYNNRDRFYWYVYNDTGVASVQFSDYENFGLWHHVVGTYESGVGLKLYVDGTERASTAFTGTINATLDDILDIGGYGSGGTDFSGLLDEVRIYPSALSSAQIFQRYLETKDGLSDNSTIVYHETADGDDYAIQVIPNDSWVDGTASDFANLHVNPATNNSRPRIDTFTPSDTTLEVNEGASLNFNHTSSDPDGDPLNYSWLLDDVEQNTTQGWTYPPGFDDAGTHNVTLTVDDGEFFDSQQWTVTVVPMSQLTIQVAGNGTTSPVPDVYVYDEGTDVSVDAIPDGGWMLGYWLLDDVDVGNETSYMVTMDSDHNLTAVFVEVPPIQYEDAYLVVRGTNNRIYYRIYNASGSSWESWNVVPNGMTCDSPTAAVYSGKLYIVVRGMDEQSLWFGSINLTDNSFSDWTRLSGATPSKPTLVRNDTQLILVVRGMNNRIYYRSYNCTSDEWEEWIVVPTGVTCDSPASTILPNELHIVVRGISATNSSMWHTRLNLTTETFSGWTRLSGATESAPTLAASQTSNKLYLTVRGLNNSTYYNTWNGTDWEGWTVVPSGATCDGPASTIIGDELHIVVRGMDGHSLWHYHINLSTSDHSGWTRISGATSSAPTLTS
jgi:hypothetical protein